MDMAQQYPAVGMGTVAGPPDPAFDYASPPELVALRDMLADARVGRPRFVLVQGERGIGKTAFLRQLSADLKDTRVLSARRGVGGRTALRGGRASRPVGWRGPPRRARGAVRSNEAGTGALRSRPRPPAAPGDLAAGDAHPGAHRRRRPGRRRVTDRDPLARCADCTTAGSSPFSPPGIPRGLLDGMRKLFSTDHGATLTLNGLDDGAVMRLGASLVGQWLPRRFVERLREHTGGNPSHIRSVLATLEGAGTAEAGDGPLPAPPSCHSVVFERLSHCGAAGRRLAAAAAVLGERCSLEPVRKLASLDEPLQPLQAAIDAGLVESRGRDVAFANPLGPRRALPPARCLGAGRSAPQGGAAGDRGGSAPSSPHRRRVRLRRGARPVRRRLCHSDGSRRFRARRIGFVRRCGRSGPARAGPRRLCAGGRGMPARSRGPGRRGPGGSKVRRWRERPDGARSARPAWPESSGG